MKTAPRVLGLVMACAAVSLLAGADHARTTIPTPPITPVYNAVPLALDPSPGSPEPTAAIVSPTFPSWLPLVQFTVAPSPPRRRAEPVSVALAAVDQREALWSPPNPTALPTVADAAAPRRPFFAVGPRVWSPSPDLSRPYLMWPNLRADPAAAQLLSDPTTFWSESEVLRARVALRDSPVPYVRYSVPVPLEPGSTIQSVPPAPDEPEPLALSEILGPRPAPR